jgi:hypothetical protein
MKNTPRATAAFINFAVCMPQGQLAAFLASHGLVSPSWKAAIENAKTLANTIGAVEALAQLQAARKATADALAAKRAMMLAAAREAWAKGDARAFDAITW